MAGGSLNVLEKETTMIKAGDALKQPCPGCGQPALQWMDTVRLTTLDSLPSSPPLDLARFACQACGQVTFFDPVVLKKIAEDGYEPPAPGQ